MDKSCCSLFAIVINFPVQSYLKAGEGSALFVWSLKQSSPNPEAAVSET